MKGSGFIYLHLIVTVELEQNLWVILVLYAFAFDMFSNFLNKKVLYDFFICIRVTSCNV